MMKLTEELFFGFLIGVFFTLSYYLSVSIYYRIKLRSKRRNVKYYERMIEEKFRGMKHDM